MPTCSKSGTEDLGSNPSPKTSAPAAGNSAKGTPVGGTANLRAYESAKIAAAWTSGTGTTNHRPSAVKTFQDGVV